jgi:hypothetical protein
MSFYRCPRSTTNTPNCGRTSNLLALFVCIFDSTMKIWANSNRSNLYSSKNTTKHQNAIPPGLKRTPCHNPPFPVYFIAHRPSLTSLTTNTRNSLQCRSHDWQPDTTTATESSSPLHLSLLLLNRPSYRTPFPIVNNRRSSHIIGCYSPFPHCTGRLVPPHSQLAPSTVQKARHFRPTRISFSA